jgi:hypothetical protein
VAGPPHSPACERRLKSAARGGRKVQRWGWIESTYGVAGCSKHGAVRTGQPPAAAADGRA